MFYEAAPPCMMVISGGSCSTESVPKAIEKSLTQFLQSRITDRVYGILDKGVIFFLAFAKSFRSAQYLFDFFFFQRPEFPVFCLDALEFFVVEPLSANFKKIAI